MATGLLAAGIDPARTTLFVQSHVPQHSELMWLLNSVTPLGELERMTQFKDKSSRLESVPAGLLNYPILQAADILLYRADRVPVGEDQVQHLELSREVARRFNARYGRTVFPEPQALLTAASRIVGLDGQAKMSKSLGNTIGLLDTPEAIWQKLRPAVTDPARVTKKDPGNPEICNIYALHKYFSDETQVTEVAANCRGARWGCLDCKRVLADNIIATPGAHPRAGREPEGAPRRRPGDHGPGGRALPDPGRRDPGRGAGHHGIPPRHGVNSGQWKRSSRRAVERGASDLHIKAGGRLRARASTGGSSR